MKIRFKLLLTFVMTLAVVIGVNSVSALDDYVDAEGNTQYGWSLIANETNQTGWEFDADGNLTYCYAAEGDTANQRVWNYAMRNLAIGGDDEYSVAATFTPDSESDLSVERTYGLVCWYQDADNYLLYWLQQKTDGAWSGQFYGRVDGAFRMIWVPEANANGALEYQDAWRKGEYYDLWWDQVNCSHPAIVGERNMLLTTKIELKVVSKVETITVGGEEVTCRGFELHQIVNDVDFVSCKFYVKQLDSTSGDFYTGVYSECFNVGISDFNITCETNFAENADALANALPTSITSTADFASIIEARNAYEALLSYKTDCQADTLSKIEAAEGLVGTYVDNLILALDNTKSTFKEDVASVYSIFESLGSLQSTVSKVSELASAVEEAKTWTDPNQTPDEPTDPVDPNEPTDPVEPNEPTEPVEPNEPSDDKKGCFGGVVTSIFGMSFLMGAIVIIKRKKD